MCLTCHMVVEIRDDYTFDPEKACIHVKRNFKENSVKRTERSEDHTKTTPI